MYSIQKFSTFFRVPTTNIIIKQYLSGGIFKRKTTTSVAFCSLSTYLFFIYSFIIIYFILPIHPSSPRSFRRIMDHGTYKHDCPGRDMYKVENDRLIEFSTEPTVEMASHNVRWMRVRVTKTPSSIVRHKPWLPHVTDLFKHTAIAARGSNYAFTRLTPSPSPPHTTVSPFFLFGRVCVCVRVYGQRVQASHPWKSLGTSFG